MKNIQIYILFIILIVIGCDDNVVNPSPPDSPVKPDKIWPLGVGNYWEYRRIQINPDESEIIELYKFGRRIVSEEVIEFNGGKIKTYIEELYNLDNDYTSPTRWLFSENNNSVNFNGGLMDTLSYYCNSTYIKFPVSKGESWYYPNINYYFSNSMFEEDGLIKMTCVDTSKTFITPTDTFNCHVYYHRLIEDGGDYLNHWDVYKYFSKNIGEVGRYTYWYDIHLDIALIYSKTYLINKNLQ